MSKKKNNESLKISLPKPKTLSQKNLLNSLKVNPMTVVYGPAGVGKSFIPASFAAYALSSKLVDKIVLTRPTVPTGRSIGFFPGNLTEKMAPWVKPILGTLEECLGKGVIECGLKNDKIEIVPFETIRGRSFDRTFVILDEAQNCTYEEIKAFVTRIGENSMTVVNGDVTQSDIRSHSGLHSIIKMVKQSPDLQKFVGLIEFTSDDIVRSGLTKIWVKEFEEVENDLQETSRNLPEFVTGEQRRCDS